MNLITPLLSQRLTPSGQREFTTNNANLKVNSILVDISFTVPENYKGRWDFTRKLLLNVNLRQGTGTGTTIAIASNVSLFALLHYSDVLAGVSTQSTNFVAGSVARISGVLPVGFFAMGANDSLEVYLTNVTGADPLPADVDVNICALYRNSGKTVIKQYRETEPTGADQPYKNVTEVFYIGKGTDKNGTFTDQLGNQNVNINRAIAATNALGMLEFFSDIGEIYRDPFGLGQNISMQIPADEAGAILLVVGLDYSPALLEKNNIEQSSQKQQLLTQIQQQDASKYQYLQYLGQA